MGSEGMGVYVRMTGLSKWTRWGWHGRWRERRRGGGREGGREGEMCLGEQLPSLTLPPLPPSLPPFQGDSELSFETCPMEFSAGVPGTGGREGGKEGGRTYA